VVEKVEPWVASIAVKSTIRGFFYNIEDEGDGSGVVVRSDGYIVTNFHVVAGADEIKVHLPNGETYDAHVVGRDVLTDLAVIKIDAEGLPTATLADSHNLRVGDWVMTIGNALALKGGPTVTLGIVSALGRTINTERGAFYDLIQTDAAINEGNSGGPLVDMNGEVVGINQAILRRAQGMGFATSASVAAPVIDSLIEHGRVIRPLIGFSGINLTPAIANELNLKVTEGVIVSSMSIDGPAFLAGIRVGDVVTSMEGTPTPDVARWLRLLWSYEVGDQIQVEYVHNNEIQLTTIKLMERPS
jgi:serine protease Do